ncbi:MAG: biotin/lipoyl-containing protein [Chloroflexota bacterium]
MTNLQITLDGQAYEIDLTLATTPGSRNTITVNEEPVELVLPENTHLAADTEWLIIDGRSYEFVLDPAMQWIKAFDGLHSLEIQDRNERVARPRSGDGRVKAPIPGLIARILVAPGEAVAAGQPLIMLEAMKMENEIRAPFDGTLGAVSVKVGETVIRGQVLAELQ